MKTKRPKHAKTIETVDRKVYWSTDNWQTAYLNGRKCRRATVLRLQLLAAFGASAGTGKSTKPTGKS